jgi:hypothetical protein
LANTSIAPADPEPEGDLLFREASLMPPGPRIMLLGSLLPEIYGGVPTGKITYPLLVGRINYLSGLLR